MTTATVSITYAVVWREGDGPLCRGRLELGEAAIRLFGLSRDGTPETLEVSAESVQAVRIGRARPERIGGRPAVVVQRDGAAELLISDAAAIGTLHELAGRLGSSLPARIP